MDPHRMRRGGTDVALVEHKNNGAISVSHWQNLNELPITQVRVSLHQGTRVPNEASFDVTPLYVHNL